MTPPTTRHNGSRMTRALSSAIYIKPHLRVVTAAQRACITRTYIKGDYANSLWLAFIVSNEFIFSLSRNGPRFLVYFCFRQWGRKLGWTSHGDVYIVRGIAPTVISALVRSRMTHEFPFHKSEQTVDGIRFFALSWSMLNHYYFLFLFFFSRKSVEYCYRLRRFAHNLDISLNFHRKQNGSANIMGIS